jgi:hypothetical protein
MSFWSDVNFEPKRQFRFKVLFTPVKGEELSFLAKAVDRPSYTVGSTSHAFFNHTFHFPGRVTWNTISLTLVDAVSPDASRTLMDYLADIGYADPSSTASEPNSQDGQTITRQTATKSLGTIKIVEYGTDERSGSKAIAHGTWELKNAFITDAAFGSLSYDSEELVDITLTLQYDWATYSKGGR